MRNSSRRTFVKIAFGASVLGAALPFASYRLDRNNRLLAHIQGVLERNLPGTTITDADVKNFAHDFFIKKEPISFKQYTLSVLNPLIRIAAQHNEFLYGKAYEFERQVVSSFLLNSDFFELGHGKKAVTYYGPVNKVCSMANPFAKFLEDE